MTNIEDVLADRTEMYGSFESNAKIMAEMMRAFNSKFDLWVGYGRVPNETRDVQQIAAMMIIAKLARIASGNPTTIIKDNWVDIAGYAQLVINHLERFENE
jgi:Domain of unknown function (DUF6378)